MSMKVGIAVAAGLCALVGLSGGAGAEMFAPSKAPKATKVSFSACAVRAGHCVFADYKGKKYNITAKAPANLGLRVKVSGVDTNNPSLCGGILLDKLVVTQTKQPCKQPKK
jgi:hypothetical protein